MTRSIGFRSIALAALVLGIALSGCSSKQAASNKTSDKTSSQTSDKTSSPASNQASNAIGLTPAAPSPLPLPYPATSVEARDVSTGQATGKRQYKPVTLVAQ